jgi:hypothetical protein
MPTLPRVSARTQLRGAIQLQRRTKRCVQFATNSQRSQTSARAEVNRYRFGEPLFPAVPAGLRSGNEETIDILLGIYALLD